MFNPVTRSQLLRFVRNRGVLEGLFGNAADNNDEEEEDEDEDDDYPYRGIRRRRRRGGLKPSPFPKIPSETGRELMESGKFGTNERLDGTYTRNRKLGTRIMQRELGMASPGKERSANRLASQVYLNFNETQTLHLECS